jgi:MFS transporter, DHA1 family, multidrug resistance protein
LPLKAPISLRERILLYALLTSLTSFSIDALLPGLRLIGAEFGAAPPLSTQHIISLFIFGMCFGELLLGPLSDAWGRKPALVLGLAIYGVGTVVAMLASSLEMVILGRFLQGVGVSGPKIATRAMIRDQFEGDAMARILSLMFTLFMLVPMLAPALAQVLIGAAGWRSLFVAYLALGTVIGVWLILRQPETLPQQSRIAFRPRLLLANARLILCHRQVSLLVVATGLVFGAQLLFLSTAADLFFDLFAITEGFPVYFAILATAIGLASLVNAGLVQRFGMDIMARTGFVGLAGAGAAMLLAHHAFGVLPLPIFMALTYVGFFALGILFGNLNAMAMRPLGQAAGLAASLIASGSSLVATGFAMVLGQFYDGTALSFASGLLMAGLSALVLAQLASHRPGTPMDVRR